MANNKWGQGQWGINDWGNQADISVAVSGQSLTTSLGTLTDVSGEINQGWGRLYWGENAWGVAGDIVALGQSLSTSISGATAKFGSSDSPTGQSLTPSVGSSTVEIATEVAVTGQALASSVGTASEATGGATIIPTGQAATTNVGAATIDERFLIGEGWGRLSWGNLVWGGAFSAVAQGQSMSTSIGSPTVQIDHQVSQAGLSLLTITQGLESIKIDGNITVFVGEPALQTSLGQQSLVQTTNESVSGQALAGSIGQVVPEPKIPVDVTGISASLSLGSITLVQTTVEAVSGQAVTTAIGSASQASIYPVTTAGALTTSVGSVAITGTAGISVSGIGLTASIGSPILTTWQEIDPGVTNNWSPVDLAA